MYIETSTVHQQSKNFLPFIWAGDATVAITPGPFRQAKPSTGSQGCNHESKVEGANRAKSEKWRGEGRVWPGRGSVNGKLEMIEFSMKLLKNISKELARDTEVIARVNENPVHG